MSRPLRIEFENAVYHITSRGNVRGDIYRDDGDWESFLEVLGEVCSRFNWDCHGYCLMSNHYHLLIETPDGNLVNGMRQLNGVYTQWFNRRHRRVGHLFQGRYKAILVEKESYLLELCRYVVLNPVRARMVRRAVDWPWSSYRAFIGAYPPPDWLNTDWSLSCFGKSRSKAIDAFKRFVTGGRGQPSPLEQLKNQMYLGSDRFVESVQSKIEGRERLKEVPRVQKRAMCRRVRAPSAN